MVHIEKEFYVDHLSVYLFLACWNESRPSIVWSGGLIFEFLQKMTHAVPFCFQIKHVVLVGFNFNVDR